jgi:hypothetical protein
VPTDSFDLLERVVTLLDDATRQGGWHQPHFLVMVTDDPDGEVVSLGTKPLPEGSHPLEHLLGFVAPESWTAIGAVCFGVASPGPRRARVVTLVSRAGNEHAVASLDDGTVIDQPGEGKVGDALRRCLGLPTAPPPCTTAELFGGQWLLAALTAGGGRRRMTWPELASLHPCMMLAELQHGRRPAPSTLVAEARDLAEALTWADLRRLTAAGSIAPARLSADIAAWMDDGMFARWVMADLPPTDRLLDDLGRTQLPNVMRRVRRTVGRL